MLERVEARLGAPRRRTQAAVRRHDGPCRGSGFDAAGGGASGWVCGKHAGSRSRRWRSVVERSGGMPIRYASDLPGGFLSWLRILGGSVENLLLHTNRNLDGTAKSAVKNQSGQGRS